MIQTEIELAYCPPTLNKVGRQHWRATQKAKKQLQSDLEQLLLVAQLRRGLDMVVCSAVLRFPQRRSRDEGNYRWLLEKALGDALVNGGWLEHDTPEHYRFERVVFDPERGPNRTVITLRY